MLYDSIVSSIDVMLLEMSLHAKSANIAAASSRRASKLMAAAPIAARYLFYDTPPRRARAPHHERAVKGCAPPPKLKSGAQHVKDTARAAMGRRAPMGVCAACICGIELMR